MEQLSDITKRALDRALPVVNCHWGKEPCRRQGVLNIVIRDIYIGWCYISVYTRRNSTPMYPGYRHEWGGADLRATQPALYVPQHPQQDCELLNEYATLAHILPSIQSGEEKGIYHEHLGLLSPSCPRGRATSEQALGILVIMSTFC